MLKIVVKNINKIKFIRKSVEEKSKIIRQFDEIEMGFHFTTELKTKKL